MEKNNLLNAADTSRVNASAEAISRAIKLLPKLGPEGYEACAGLQNASDFLVALIGIQARNIAALTHEFNELVKALHAANAHIDDLQGEIAAAMDSMMPDRTIFQNPEMPF